MGLAGTTTHTVPGPSGGVRTGRAAGPSSSFPSVSWASRQSHPPLCAVWPTSRGWGHRGRHPSVATWSWSLAPADSGPGRWHAHGLGLLCHMDFVTWSTFLPPSSSWFPRLENGGRGARQSPRRQVRTAVPLWLPEPRPTSPSGRCSSSHGAVGPQSLSQHRAGSGHPSCGSELALDVCGC